MKNIQCKILSMCFIKKFPKVVYLQNFYQELVIFAVYFDSFDVNAFNISINQIIRKLVHERITVF